MRKNILIILIVTVVALIGVVIYMLAGQTPGVPSNGGTTGNLPNVGTTGNTATTGTGNTSNNNGGATSGNSQNGASSSGFGIIANTPVFDYFVDAKNTVTAIAPDGTVFQVAGGTQTMLNSTKITGLISAGFSFDGKKVLANFGDPNNPQTSVFDVASKSWGSLPAGILSPRWAPSDYRIAYLTQSTTGKMNIVTLLASNLKNAPVVLGSMNAEDLAHQWLDKNRLVLADKPSFYAPGSAIVFNIQTKTMTPIILEEPGLETIWGGAAANPVGVAFMDGAAGQTPSLELISTTGSVLKTLSFFTLPTKCVIAPQTTSTATLYCGIPRDTSALLAGRVPDNYNEMDVFTSDNLYAVNLQTGNITTLWDDSVQNVDASDMKKIGNTLFFINRYDQKLYGLML